MAVFKVPLLPWHDRNGDLSDVVMRLCVIIKYPSFHRPWMKFGFRDVARIVYPNNLLVRDAILSAKDAVILEPSTVFLVDDSFCIYETRRPHCGYRLLTLRHC
jgi:hypothetical protein